QLLAQPGVVRDQLQDAQSLGPIGPAEMLEDGGREAQGRSLCLDLLLHRRPAGTAVQGKALSRADERAAIPAAEHVYSILGHLSVGGELSSHNGDKARGTLQHSMGAREPGRRVLRA